MRYEMLCDGVAVAVVRRTTDAAVLVRVAKLLPDGRVKQLRKESRAGFRSPREVIAYFESLYARYGNPDR